MSNVNSGTQWRFPNGGKVEINNKVVLNLPQNGGDLSWEVPGYTPVQTYDRNRLSDVLPGSERPCKVSLKVKFTSATAADSIVPEITGALSAGKIDNKTGAGKLYTFPMKVTRYSALGATTGESVTFAACYSDPALKVDCNKGEDTDELVLQCMDAEASPTFAAVP